MATAKTEGINSVEMMVNFALKGKMNEISIKRNVNPNFKEWGCNISFLAKPGKIVKITGIEEVSSFPGIIDVIPTYQEGDIIPATALGTLEQIIVRVFAIAETKQELAATIEKIHNTIKVYSEDEESMLMQTFDTRELFS